MSIRNEETIRAVRALARRTGAGLTEAVDDAVHRRLAELEQADLADTLEAKLARFQRVRAALDAFREGLDLDQILRDEDLYDEVGLPR